MWLVSPDTGAFSSLGSGWGGPTLMTTEGGFIYVIQDNTLWKVDPNGPPNHNFVGLTGAIWSGATSMTSTPDTLYVIRNSTLYRYDLVDDSLATESGPIWTGPTLMAGRFTFVK